MFKKIAANEFKVIIFNKTLAAHSGALVLRLLAGAVVWRLLLAAGARCSGAGRRCCSELEVGRLPGTRSGPAVGRQLMRWRLRGLPDGVAGSLMVVWLGAGDGVMWRCGGSGGGDGGCHG